MDKNKIQNLENNRKKPYLTENIKHETANKLLPLYNSRKVATHERILQQHSITNTKLELESKHNENNTNYNTFRMENKLQKKMTKTITLLVKDILYNTGKEETTVITPKEWAGRIRRKGYKKSIIIQKELASITIKIKRK